MVVKDVGKMVSKTSRTPSCSKVSDVVSFPSLGTAKGFFVKSKVVVTDCAMATAAKKRAINDK